MDIIFEVTTKERYRGDFKPTHVFGEAGGIIGRGEDCEWVLPDRSKKISRHHAQITFENGEFYLEDMSSNGVFLSVGRVPIGTGKRHKIEHGDGFAIGEYTIQARLLYDPSGYVQSADRTRDTVLGVASPMPLHPIAAMEHEEEQTAKERLDGFNPLLGGVSRPMLKQSNHSEALLTSIPSMNAVPEKSEIIPDDWDVALGDEDVVIEEESNPLQSKELVEPAQSLPFRPESASTHAEPAAPTFTSVGSTGETDAFFKALGFGEPPGSTEERKRMLVLCANLLRASMEGMTHTLHARAATKNELRLSVTVANLNVTNNPLKYSPTPEAALSVLLGPAQKGVLGPVDAVREAFCDLHSHHMGLLAGARAAVRASLDRVSPIAVEQRLDIHGKVRLFRFKRLWNLFSKMHRKIHDDDDGYAGLFLQDFARAYEVQARTLDTHPGKKGVTL